MRPASPCDLLRLVPLTLVVAACAGSPITVPSAPAPAPAVRVEGRKNETICRADREVRILESQVRGAGCQLNYTKRGVTRIIAASSTSALHCDEPRANLKATLEKSGFVCRNR